MRACRASRWTRRASGARGTRAGADFSAHRGFPMSPVELESVLTCPLCGVSTRETMPTNACRWFHECAACHAIFQPLPGDCRSEEHTSELQSLMRISYAVFCLKKNKQTNLI